MGGGVFLGGLERVLFYLFCGSEKSRSQTGLVFGKLDRECLRTVFMPSSIWNPATPHHPPQHPKPHLTPPLPNGLCSVFFFTKTLARHANDDKGKALRELMCCCHGDVLPLNKGALCSNPRGLSLAWELGLSHLSIKVTPGDTQMRAEEAGSCHGEGSQQESYQPTTEKGNGVKRGKV